MNSEVKILEDIIDVPKGTEVFQTFLGKTSARITAREQEALMKNYSKLLQLVNDSATKYCTAIQERFVKDSSVLKKPIEEQQLKLNDRSKCIARLEDEIRKIKNEALKQIGQSGEDSVEKSRQVSRAKDDYNKLKENHRALLEAEKALRKENTELSQEYRKRLSLTRTIEDDNRRLSDEVNDQVVEIQRLTQLISDQKHDYEKQLEDQQKAICAQEDDIELLQAQLAALNQNQPNAPIQPNNQANMATQDQISTAVKTAFQTIISEEDKKRIPVFTGNTKDTHFAEWLKKAERVATKNGWSDDDKLKHFCDRLDGGAADFNKKGLWPPNTQQNAKTLALWLKCMTEKYTTPMDKERIRHQLSTLRQKTDQSMQDFIDQINELFSQSYGEDQATSTNVLVKANRDDIKTRILSSGILPKYKNEFWNRTENIEQDFDALAKVAIAAEQIVQKREILEQSCVIAEIIESSSNNKELIKEQKKEVEAVKRDLAELKEKITANVDAVSATQQQQNN